MSRINHAAIILLGCAIGAAGCGSAEQDAANLEQYRQQLVTGKCEELVKDRLVSPGSARFSGERVTGSAAAGWRVAGSVDSQNGFGSLIRSNMSCSATYTADGDIIRVVVESLEQR